jgi:hypothetical protein
MSVERNRVVSARGGKDLCRMGVGVLAGGLLFVGQAKAVPVINESFEVNPSKLFGVFSSYAYNQNYTSVNTPPGGGERYFTGDTGLFEQTHTATVGLTDLGAGIPAAAIDAGLGRYDLSAYFSTYQGQNDFSEVRLQFTDASGSAVAPMIAIGGLDFVSALDFAPNAGGVAGHRDFGLDTEVGDIPLGARSAEVTIYTQRLAGAAADGYLDLLRLDVTAVPEPGGAAALVGLTAAMTRRRRRSPRKPGA